MQCVDISLHITFIFGFCDSPSQSHYRQHSTGSRDSPKTSTTACSRFLPSALVRVLILSSLPPQHRLCPSSPPPLGSVHTPPRCTPPSYECAVRVSLFDDPIDFRPRRRTTTTAKRARQILLKAKPGMPLKVVGISPISCAVLASPSPR